MGLTAKVVVNEFNISHKDQDEFVYQSHQKVLKALEENRFASQIVPLEVEMNVLDENEKVQTKKIVFDKDEGPRADTSLEALARLRPVFANGGSVTAGNSSQMYDGAAFVMIMLEVMV